MLCLCFLWLDYYNAQKNFLEFTEKNQEQVRMRLTDAIFARMVADVRSMMESMPSEQKADLVTTDGFTDSDKQ